MDDAAVGAAIDDVPISILPAGPVLRSTLLGRHILVSAGTAPTHVAGWPTATTRCVAQGLAHGGLALADIFPVAGHAKQKLATVDGVRRATHHQAKAENKA